MWDADECAEEADDRADRADFAGGRPRDFTGALRTGANIAGGRARRYGTATVARVAKGRTDGAERQTATAAWGRQPRRRPDRDWIVGGLKKFD